MAAYSAVACFRQTLQQLLDSDQFPDDFPKPETQNLLKNISILQSSLDSITFVPKTWRKPMHKLQDKMREAIYAAQDKAEYSIKGHSSPEISEKKTLKEIVDKIDAITKEAVATTEKIINDPKAQNLFTENPKLTKFNFSGKDTIVGQKKDKIRVTEELTSNDRKRLVIPITGLPGIGKTTLARSIYDNQQIVAQFNIRAWVTVSQDFTYQEIFSKILSTMESKNHKEGHYAKQGDEQTLRTHLHQELYNLKYLIVVDDVWESSVWDRVMLALPDKENSSRVLLTSRLPDVARIIQKEGYVHTMVPLSPEKSWKLLCYKVFEVEEEEAPPLQKILLTDEKGRSSRKKGATDEEPRTPKKVQDIPPPLPKKKKKDITKECPPHLSETGFNIARKCKGLPLSLTVVGGLLFQEREKIDYWERIKEDVGDAAAKGGDETYLDILALSYIYLPGKLKGCFLYMGAFPEDSEIRVSKLIKLWVAEGFITIADPSVESGARKSLEDLIGRNLLSIRRKSSDGGMKVCGMHDSLRDLAETQSGMEKFFHSRKKYNQSAKKENQPEKKENQPEKKYKEIDQRRVSVHRNILMCLEDVYEQTKQITYSRSLLHVGVHHHHPIPFVLTFDLLRVLDAFTVYYIQFPDEFLDLVHLTYLSFTYNGKLPARIAKLDKLQVLMVRREPKIIFVGASFLPDEIWEMPQLRHLWFTETDFPDLPSQVSENRVVLLMNLQTLANVNAAYFTDDVLNNMPNVRKLSMWIESPAKIEFSVNKLEKLEFFKFVVLNPIPGEKRGIQIDPKTFFPNKLKRLNLSGCGLPWEYMKIVAELPDLEVLKLRELAFYGDEWILTYKFKKLKYLLIEYLNFKTWKAKETQFPILERLILRHCYELDDIPQDVIYINTLEQIELVDCSPDAVSSADDIAENLVKLGKTSTQVRIFSSWE